MNNPRIYHVAASQLFQKEHIKNKSKYLLDKSEITINASNVNKNNNMLKKFKNGSKINIHTLKQSFNINTSSSNCHAKQTFEYHNHKQ